jgi:DNA-binding NarL/FixJ family response regulator
MHSGGPEGVLMTPDPPSDLGRRAGKRGAHAFPQPIRVLVVDDHRLLRDAIRTLLEDVPGIEWVGEAQDGAEAIDQVVRIRPDVVLMDLAMPGVDGLTATEFISRDHPAVRVLVLTSYADAMHMRAARDAGAWGFLSKDGDPATIVAGIRAVVAGVRAPLGF